MIRALLTGVLYNDPISRIGASGKPFTTAKLRADGKDGGAIWCSLIGFGEQAERLAMLKANAPVSVSGKAELQAWANKQGEPTAGISLVIDEIAALKARPRPKQPPQREFAPAEFDDGEGWQ